MSTSFSAAHRLYVKSLYKRYLTNALNWTVRRDVWRLQAIEIRAEFERNRYVGFFAFWPQCKGTQRLRLSPSNVHDPRALAKIFQKAEADLAARQHIDPYIRTLQSQGLSLSSCARTANHQITSTAPDAPGGTKWCVLV